MIYGPTGTVTPLAIQRRKIYIALDDLDFNFFWDEAEIPDIERMWNAGFSIWDIANACMRDPDEVAILIMDRTRKGFIKPRPGGVYGRRVKR
ncbi:helix-turn-helix domain-containing protein [Polycladomyces sp. WAk]|uniref:Helix-turn-helix domain-containing protein n=1 Tax=Polycladomyces zharkentensis TaxID=2807616 RepID=A0ABS2WMI8_9BACL|nr:helix-turn-helix domain-containing protein [Polycladomyces sp. WAk]MBN2910792.1 helix-turn-helix domain-containing protein [Polycladomyces sp. WAk]